MNEEEGSRIEPALLSVSVAILIGVLVRLVL